MADKAVKKDDEMGFISTITLNEKNPSGKDVEVIEKMNQVKKLPQFRFMDLVDIARYFLIERADQELSKAGQLSQTG